MQITKMSREDADFLLACCEGDIKIVNHYLNSHGIEKINALKDKDGMNALMLACKNGHLKIVTKILNHAMNDDFVIDYEKFNINSRDINGRTAFMHAALNGHYIIMKGLLRFGCDMHAIDDMGKSVIQLLVEGVGSSLTLWTEQRKMKSTSLKSASRKLPVSLPISEEPTLSADAEKAYSYLLTIFPLRETLLMLFNMVVTKEFSIEGKSLPFKCSKQETVLLLSKLLVALNVMEIELVGMFYSQPYSDKMELLDILIESLKNNTQIQSLILDENGLGNYGAKKVVALCEHCPSLNQISLVDNNIDDNGAAEIANQIRRLQRSIVIDTRSNNIELDGLQALLSAMKGDHQPTEILVGGWFTTDCIKYLTENLRSFDKITRIATNFFDVDINTIVPFLEVIAAKKVPIVDLQIGEDPRNYMKFFTAVFEAIFSNSSMKSLTLYLRADWMLHNYRPLLLEAMKRNKSLLSMNLFCQSSSPRNQLRIILNDDEIGILERNQKILSSEKAVKLIAREFHLEITHLKIISQLKLLPKPILIMIAAYARNPEVHSKEDAEHIARQIISPPNKP